MSYRCWKFEASKCFNCGDFRVFHGDICLYISGGITIKPWFNNDYDPVEYVMYHPLFDLLIPLRKQCHVTSGWWSGFNTDYDFDEGGVLVITAFIFEFPERRQVVPSLNTNLQLHVPCSIHLLKFVNLPWRLFLLSPPKPNVHNFEVWKPKM